MFTLEVRAGDGGDDAEQFAQEVADALTRWVAREGCKTKDVTSGRTLTFQVDRHAATMLERWSGIHRIQRIPKNDKKGRRHTSTVTVAIVGKKRPKVEVDIKNVDFQTFRSSGPGGQHKNKNDTAVRAVHKPTGITVIADSKSQHANRQQALAELGVRLQKRASERAGKQVADARNRQFDPDVVGAKSFTHNWQRNEVVDEQTGKRWRVKDWLAGKM